MESPLKRKREEASSLVASAEAILESPVTDSREPFRELTEAREVIRDLVLEVQRLKELEGAPVRKKLRVSCNNTCFGQTLLTNVDTCQLPHVRGGYESIWSY
jgi:hypothetical protein